MVKKVAVIGSGIMGQGISQVFIKQGFDTLLIDISDEILENAKNSIADGKYGLARLVQKGTITEEQMDILSRNLGRSSSMAKNTLINRS